MANGRLIIGIVVIMVAIALLFVFGSELTFFLSSLSGQDFSMVVSGGSGGVPIL